MIQTLKTFIRRQNRSAERLGLDKIHVGHADGSYTTVREEMKKAKAKENANAAIRNASKGKGGR